MKMNEISKMKIAIIISAKWRNEIIMASMKNENNEIINIEIIMKISAIVMKMKSEMAK
jgi:hypothetical protein